MILSDFLSRQKHDQSNEHEIIPISFNMQNILQLNIIIKAKDISEIFNSDTIRSKI